MTNKILIGWREWATLPLLDIPGIKLKTDTGARTSALHAEDIEVVETPDGLKARFVVHPLPRTRQFARVCMAPIVDQRSVRDSGGHREMRYVISTTVVLGAHSREIELTLTSRTDMRFRMLLGRTAIASDFIVDPGASYLLGRRKVKKIYSE